MQDFIFQEVLYEFDTLDSTNEEAKRKINSEKAENVFCITSEIQTNGRGRMERKWDSSFKGNIYLTFAINENFIPFELQEILPLYTAFAILKAVNSEKIKYKWANDLLIENQKFAGILIEKYKGFFLIGIGINIKSAPENTIFPATFLEKFNLTTTPEEIFNSFQKNLNANKEFIINKLAEIFFSKDEIQVNQGQFKGFFKQIKSNGNLILTLENGMQKEISFGDISNFY